MIHAPDLAVLGAIDDPASRHYAVLGAVLALAAQIDHAMHAVHFAAVSEGETGADETPSLRPTGARRDALDAALRRFGAPAGWDDLYPDLVEVTTVQGPQNPDLPWLVHESSRLRLEDGRMVIESVFESRADDLRQSTDDLLALAVAQARVRDRLHEIALSLTASA